MAQHGTCQKRGGDTGADGTDQPEECWEEEERLNCALRAFFGRAVRWMEIHQVNLEYEQSAMTGIISSGFFTESLILAQNERWRRV